MGHRLLHPQSLDRHRPDHFLRAALPSPANSQNRPQWHHALTEVILGGYNGQRELVAAGGQKALQETDRGWNAITELKNIFDLKHVLAVELVDLGSQFSGSITDESFVSCSFAEHKAGFLEIETRESLGVVKSSGRDLHNCVIAVRLSNAAGDSYMNFYFVPKWPKNERRVALYSDTDFPRITVDNIARVDVSVRATEFSIQPVVLKMPPAGWPEPKSECSSRPSSLLMLDLSSGIDADDPCARLGGGGAKSFK